MVKSQAFGADNWCERHPKLSLLILFVVIIALGEGTLRVLAHYGYVPIAYYETSAPESRFLGDINERFGVWHYPNRKMRHSTPCFDVWYSSNEYGARDKPRSRVSAEASRYVVLGDSFVEGVGVSLGERVTDIAEQSSGFEFLNFGVSGSFGSIQQWLLYQELASTFSHTGVLIFMLPANDFKDNDPTSFSQGRYRPYLRRSSNGEFESYYTVSFKNRELPGSISEFKALRHALYNNLYTANVLRQVGKLLELQIDEQAINEIVPGVAPTWYDNFSTTDLERVLYSYKQIIRLAEGRPVSIYIIPEQDDFRSYYSGRNHFRIVTALQGFAKNYNNVNVHDLLPHFVDYVRQNGGSYQELFHSCDAHWSPLGHRVAASAVLSSTLK